MSIWLSQCERKGFGGKRRVLEPVVPPMIMKAKGGVDPKILDNLAEELVKAGLITKDQLAVAQVTQRNLGGDIGHILIKKGFLTAQKIQKFIAEGLHLPIVTLKDYTIDPSAIKIVPVNLAQKFHFIAITKTEDSLLIAMADPLDLFALDEVKASVKCSVIEPVFAPKDEIEAAIALHYRAHDELSTVAEDAIEVVDYGWSGEAITDRLEELATGSRVVSMVNGIIIKAYNEQASDIHIEPQQDSVRIRYRIDGLLEERLIFNKRMLLPVVSRLKIMGGMDIAERRVPQDGRVRLKMQGHQIDLRLSTYPTMHGEKVVIRLLVRETIIGLEEVGFSDEDRHKFTEVITRPYGIFLVTGPTGSGKTTTLYAALQKVNSQERNIVSIEDPIENEIVGLAQAQVNIKAGLTFASALRSILRQDPDVIMIGEIRDNETADIAVRSAVTGHLVFSTLHTNTAVGAVSRLTDLGIQPFMISSSLLGVLSQRLVRKVCLGCKAERDAEPEQVEYLKNCLSAKSHLHKFFEKPVKLSYGMGCKTCRMSGHKGRTGIFELLTINDKLRKMISEKVPEDRLREEVRSMGVTDIREDGVAKVLKGISTMEEVVRVTQEE